MGNYVVGKVSQIPDEGAIAVQAGRRTLAIFRIEDEIFAISNKCPHKGASLCEGIVVKKDAVVRCPWHHWNWSLRSGTLDADERQALRTFPVTIEDGMVIVSA